MLSISICRLCLDTYYEYHARGALCTLGSIKIERFGIVSVASVWHMLVRAHKQLTSIKDNVDEGDMMLGKDWCNIWPQVSQINWFGNVTHSNFAKLLATVGDLLQEFNQIKLNLNFM